MFCVKLILPSVANIVRLVVFLKGLGYKDLSDKKDRRSYGWHFKYCGSESSSLTLTKTNRVHFQMQADLRNLDSGSSPTHSYAMSHRICRVYGGTARIRHDKTAVYGRSMIGS